MIRSVSVGFLLLILCSQWVSGIFSVQQTVTVEVPQFADPDTEQFTYSFQEKHGLHAHLLTMDSLDHRFLNVTGYGTAFIVKSTTAEDPQLVMMHARMQAVEIVEQILDDTSSPYTEDRNPGLVERLFSTLFIEDLPLLSTRQWTESRMDISLFLQLHDLYAYSTPSPPPWQA